MACETLIIILPLYHVSDATHNMTWTGLARALSFPRRLDEITADGKMVHYRYADRKLLPCMCGYISKYEIKLTVIC